MSAEVSGHVCPNYCHCCPDLHGEIMPMCWGSIVRPEDLGFCTCVKTPADECEREELAERIDALLYDLGRPVAA